VRAGPVGGRAVRFAFPGLDGGPGALLAAHADGGAARLSYESGLDVSAFLQGPSLVLDLRSRTAALTGLEVRPATDDGASGVELPYLNDPPAAARPPLLAWRGRDGHPPLFASVVLDPAVSRAARWEFLDGARRGAAAWTARHVAPAGGRPPLLRERVVLTASDRIEDVLPSLPAAAGAPAPADLRARTWFEGRAMEDGLREPVESALARYGVPAAELAWLRSAYPEWGAASAFLSDDVIDPGNPYWMRDALRRDEAGGWVPGDRPGTWRAKAAYACAWLESDPLVELAYGGPSAAALFVPVADRAPWAWQDLDRRSPGAGQFRWSWMDLGAALRSVSGRVGTLAGGDDGAFFHAGWTAVVATSAERGGRLLREPPLPLFLLHRLSPQACVLGPPMDPGAAAAEEDALYAALASHVAHGWAPRWRPDADPALVARCHRLLRPLALRCWGRPVEEAGFECDGRLRPAAEAVAEGTCRSGRLYVRYAGGIELWVNAAAAAPWDVRAGADDWTLPPAGWLAVGRGFIAASAQSRGRRVDFVAEPDAIFYDGHGSTEIFRGLRSAGAFRMQAEPGGGATIRRFDGAPADLSFAKGAVPAWPGEAGRRASWRDRSGTETGGATLTVSGDWVTLACPGHAVEVTIR